MKESCGFGIVFWQLLLVKPQLSQDSRSLQKLVDGSIQRLHQKINQVQFGRKGWTLKRFSDKSLSLLVLSSVAFILLEELLDLSKYCRLFRIYNIKLQGCCCLQQELVVSLAVVFITWADRTSLSSLSVARWLGSLVTGIGYSYPGLQESQERNAYGRMSNERLTLSPRWCKTKLVSGSNFHWIIQAQTSRS